MGCLASECRGSQCRTASIGIIASRRNLRRKNRYQASGTTNKIRNKNIYGSWRRPIESLISKSSANTRRPRPNFRKGLLQPVQGKGHKKPPRASEKATGDHGRLRNRCLCPSVMPRSSRPRLGGLFDGGADILLFWRCKLGDCAHESRRRHFHHI